MGMIFPPVIERELRVASRLRGTYWRRFGIGAMAIFLCAGVYLVNLGEPQTRVGPYIFIGMAILAFIYALFAGRTFTADCLSSEKRDGTLGLLFLTDLKGYDVVLGKLAATSLNGFLGLLALMPIMAIPLMMGGVTAGQFWRMVIVLLNTFFFSLALGIFTSAICRDQRRALGINSSLLLTLTLVIPGVFLLIAGLAGAASPPFIVCYPSPLFPFVVAFEGVRGVSTYSLTTHFIASTTLIHALAWLFIALASRIVPNSWQDKAIRVPKALPLDVALPPGQRRGHHRIEYRRRLLSANPFFWLASRNPFKPAQVWIFFARMAAWWIWSRISTGVWFEVETMIMLTLLINTTLKLWVMIESGQKLAEDQRAGALELLLSTPLTAGDILRGQFMALRRQFLKPFVVAAVVEVIFFVMTFWRPSNGPHTTAQFYTALFFLCALILLVADAVTASWVAMQFALVARGPQRAASATFLRVLVLPWVLYGIITVSISLLLFILDVHWSDADNSGTVAQFGLWFGCGIAVDLLFGLRARQLLLTKFRILATEQSARKHAATE